MSQSTPATPSPGTILFTWLVPVCLAATRQRRVGQRLVHLTVGLLLVGGRTMLSRVLLVLGRGDADWSAAYRLFARGRVDLEVLRREVVQRWLAQLGPRTPLVTVVDGTQLPRTGRRMPGATWHPPRPALGGAERADPAFGGRRQSRHPPMVRTGPGPDGAGMG